jgi:hypothetical protein
MATRQFSFATLWKRSQLNTPLAYDFPRRVELSHNREESFGARCANTALKVYLHKGWL